MGQFLTFALVAPMASFGTLAVGERRDGSDRPARSAVLGLVGACLGLTRDDEDAQKDLAHQYGLAVLCHASGRLLTDYHTTQTAPARRNWTPATRAQELADAPGEIATILSRRDYRMGSWHLGVLWVRADMPRWSLDSIKMAMQQPVFSPSLGRKSCPPGLPLAPDVQSADNAITAVLDRYKHGPEQSVQTRFGLFKNHLTGPDTQTDLLVVMDTADVAAHGGNYPVVRHEMRRDQPLSRTRWQFGLREEAMLLCKKDIAI